MSGFVSVTVSTTIDLSHIDARLSGEVLQVFEESGREMSNAIDKQWRGWKYKGRDMGTTGRSSLGWTYEIQATEGVRVLVFLNEAKTPKTKKGKGGKHYAAFVARKKGAVEEWKIVQENLTRDHLPRMVKAVIAALAKGMTQGPSKQVRENKQTAYNKLKIT